MKISEEILSEITCLKDKESKEFLMELIVFEKSIIFKSMPQYKDKISKMISKYIGAEEETKIEEEGGDAED